MANSCRDFVLSEAHKSCVSLAGIQFRARGVLLGFLQILNPDGSIASDLAAVTLLCV